MDITTSLNSRQGGLAMVMSLFFLLLLMLIGVYLTRSSTMDMRMAGNAGAKAVSFENSEDARMDAEAILFGISDAISAGGDYDCAVLGKGYYAQPGVGANCTALTIANLDWDTDDSLVNPDNANGIFVIEFVGEDKIFDLGDDVETGTGEPNKISVHVFRVVGQGVEGSGASSTVKTIFLTRKS